MTPTEAKFVNLIPDNDGLSYILPLQHKLDSFKTALDKCIEECNDLRLKKELLENYTNILDAIIEGVTCSGETRSIICLDKAKSLCNLFNEYFFIIFDEVSEGTFDQLDTTLFQIKQELGAWIDLGFAKMAYADRSYHPKS